MKSKPSLTYTLLKLSVSSLIIIDFYDLAYFLSFQKQAKQLD